MNGIEKRWCETHEAIDTCAEGIPPVKRRRRSVYPKVAPALRWKARR